MAALLASFVLKNIGRKNILVSLLHFGYEKGRVSGLVILIFIFLMVVVFAFSISTICWLYIPEVIQPSLVPFTTLTKWVCTCLFVVLYPIILGDKTGLETVGIVIFAGTLVSAIIVEKMAVETKGKTELEIRQEFNMKTLC